MVADMKDASEEEEDDEHYLDKSMTSANSQTGKTRKQRQEELRKMMDEDGKSNRRIHSCGRDTE
jgi:hypothetical protein